MSDRKSRERTRYERQQWKLRNRKRIDAAKTVLVLGLVVMVIGFIVLNWR
ncbi:hypothetical protein [Sinomonas halotolerans]|uniref:Uncharacterized protein n=1 Tax=Sinomonas halotolerans TaxID=1644133 RepID=A0ABU9WYL3_9MICC